VLRFDPVEYLGKTNNGINAKHSQYVLHSPTNNNLLRVYFVMQFIHGPVVIHVDCDLLVRFAV
jgi:hypothetical protein